VNQVFVKEIVFILIFAFLGGILALKLKKPAIIGYLISGTILSLPYFSKYIIIDIVRDVAQIGVALLLFTTGLEFSISKFLMIRKQIILAAISQIILFIIASSFIFSKLGFTKYEAIFLSAAFSNSATIVVLQMIEKAQSIDKKLSEMIISWMILQDISMVMIAVFISTISTGSHINVYVILESIAKSLLFICFAIILGKNIIPKIFEAVSKLHSFEILLILSFCFCMVIAYFAEVIGLSFTLGAFLAGIMISESFVNHEIFSEVKPLRDLFSIIFFVTLGVLIPISFLLPNLLKILFVLILLLIIKFLTIFTITLFFEKQTRTAFILGLILTQGGEFTFILSQIGLDKGWINEEFYSLNIIVSLISLLTAPFIITNASIWFYNLRDKIRIKSPNLYRLFFIKLDKIVDVDQPSLDKHIVICGFGRVGSYVGKALDKVNIPYIVIDSNSETVDYCKKRGIKVVFGDAVNIDILEKADVERAVALVVALPEEAATELIATNANHLNPNIKVIARSHIPAEDRKLKVRGVTITVEPEFEAAISISRKILSYFGRKDINITEFLKKSRRRHISRFNKKHQTSFRINH